MNSNVLNVLDLTPGMGGRALAFCREGFHVECLKDVDAENSSYCQRIVGPDGIIDKSILDVNETDLPDADIISADVTFNTSSINKKSEYELNTNSRISNIILKKYPIMFMLRLPQTALKKSASEFIDVAVLRRYFVQYKVFKEAEYSHLPISGNQVYMIGIRSDIHETFYFKQPDYMISEQAVYVEAPYAVDEWYRKIKIPYDCDTSLLNIANSRYYIMQKNTIQESNIIYMHPYKQTYLLDEIGLRRFTHDEYGSMKGYPVGFFQPVSNKFKMYRKIYEAPNIYLQNLYGV